MKLRLAVIIGHTKRAQGANSKILGSEYVYNTDLAHRIQKYAEGEGVQVSIFTRDKGGISGAFKAALATKPHAIMELHYNAFNGKASGSEVLFSDNFDKAGVKELALAHLVSRAMASALGITNRGVKEIAKRGERGFHNLAQTTHVPGILLESGFGDNPNDAGRMKARKWQLAKSIVDAFLKWKLG